MTIHRTILPNGQIGWQWGSSGKKYATKQEAQSQMKAIFANGYKGGKKASKGQQVALAAPILAGSWLIGSSLPDLVLGKPYAATKAAIGGTIMAPSIIGVIAGLAAKKRTQKQQQQHDKQDFRAVDLIPGYAGYSLAKSYVPNMGATK